MTIGSQEAAEMATTTERPLEHVPRMKYGPIVRGFLLRFCVAVTIGFMLLVLGELGTYFRGIENQHSMEPDLQAAAVQGNADERQYWKEQEPAQKVQYEPYVLWRRAPFNGKAISINAEGVRRTLHTNCDASTFTIWTFGDSVMWGWGSPDSETIPSLLAADYEKVGRQVCIVNYGEKGWANTQEMIGLMEYLKHTDHKPNVVLFYDGGTEAFTAYENRQVDVHSNYFEIKNHFEGMSAEKKSGFSYLRRTNTYRFLESVAAKIAPKESKKAEESVSEADAQNWSRGIMQNYLQNMDIIELLGKQYGFRPIFVWYPNMAVGHKQLTTEEVVLKRRLDMKFPDMDMVYRAAYDRCREVSRPDLYDLGDLLDDSPGMLYHGISHLNAAGNQIAADRLFQILENTTKPNRTKNTVSETRSVEVSAAAIANTTKP